MKGTENTIKKLERRLTRRPTKNTFSPCPKDMRFLSAVHLQPQHVILPKEFR